MINGSGGDDESISGLLIIVVIESDISEESGQY